MSSYRWFSVALLASLTVVSGASAEQLAVGSGIDPSQGLWLIAQQKGFASKYGLQLDVKTFESGSFPLEAVTAGDLVGAGTNGALPSLGGRAKGGRYLGVARGLTAPR